MPPPSSTVAKLELALRMRQYRKDAGIGGAEASSRMGFSRNYLSGLENGREILSRDKLDDLVALYDLDATEASELDALVTTARTHGWWEEPPYAHLLSEDMQQVYGLEHGASEARVFENVIVSGLLQTEDYARALMRSDVMNSRAVIGPLLDSRVRRQQRLRGDDPMRLTVVMGQAAIVQQVGGRDVLRRQLIHLAELVGELSETLAVHVLPFDAAELPMAGASTIVFFGFDSGRLGTIVWREAGLPVGFADEPELVRALVLNMDFAFEASLSREASLELIHAQIDELQVGS